MNRSYIDEIFRLYGLETTLTGTSHLRNLVSGEKVLEDLSYEQIKQILAAWDTRNFVPANQLENVDKVVPSITKEEVIRKDYTQEDYDRNMVEMITKYFQSQL